LSLQGFLYALMAICAGALFPVQFAANAWLARGVGGPIAGTIISFATGLIVLLILNAAVFRQFPQIADLRAQPLPLLWIGGLLGATYVSANVFLAPRLGAAATLCFVIAGQLVAAMTIDRLGVMGFSVRELSLGRVGGVLLVLVGAIVVRLG
jgi:bacterial/archaeal transporter family-2 protein